MIISTCPTDEHELSLRLEAAEYHFLRAIGEKNSIRSLLRLLIGRRVFRETFRTKCASSLQESSDEVSPAENSSALLARSATQFVKLSATDGTGYRYNCYWQQFVLRS